MKSTGFKDVFSLSERVVYNDFDIGATADIPLHLYVMPAASLITDAKARNRVFEEVLRFNMEKNAPSVDSAVQDPALEANRSGSPLAV
jgi:hypothetical protein